MSILAADQLVPGHTVSSQGVRPGPNGALLRGQRDRDGREVVVKTFRPAALLDDEAERADRQRRVESFLATAALQQKLAATAAHWAPVYDVGPLPDDGAGPGAFYTAELFPASGTDLTRLGGPDLGSAELRRIVVGVLEGLLEIRAGCHRGHGRLTPGNVLLDGPAAKWGRPTRVLLTDPSPDATAHDTPGDGSGADALPDEADDRWAVGALIYALVTHKTMRRMTLLPEAPDEAWAKLRPDADRWLKLCARLLVPDPARRPALTEVLAELAERGPSRSARVARLAAVAGAVLAVAGAAGVGGYAYAFRRAVARLDAAEQPWLASLVQATRENKPASPTPLSALVAKDPWLSARLTPLLVQVPAGGAGGTAGWHVPTAAEFAAVRGANQKLDDIKQAFTDPRWLLRVRVQGLLGRANQNGWAALATRLDATLAGLPPGGSEQAAHNLQAFLDRAPALLDADRRLTTDWAAFDQQSQEVANDKDPAAAELARALRSRLSGTVAQALLDRLDGTGTADLPRLADGVLACRALGDLLQRRTTDQDSFQKVERAIRLAFDAKAPGAAPNLDEWLHALADNHVRVAVDGLPQVVRLDSSLNSARAALGTMPVRSPALATRCDDAAAAVKAIHDRVWVRQKLDDLTRQCASAQGQIDGVRSDITTTVAAANAAAAAKAAAEAAAAARLEQAKIHVRDWMADVRSRSAAQVPPGAAPQWTAVLSALDAEASGLVEDESRLVQRQRDVAKWLTGLSAAGAGDVPGLWPTDRICAGTRHHARLLDKARGRMWAAMPAIDLRSEPPTIQSLRAAIASDPWVASYCQFLSDFPLPPSWADLATGDAVRGRWIDPTSASPANRAFWAEDVVAAGMLNDVAALWTSAHHLDVLAQTARPDRDQLVRAMNPTLDPKGTHAVDLSLVAKLRLEHLPAGDAWPRTVTELTTAATWFPQWLTAVQKHPELGLTRDEVADLVARHRAGWARVVTAAATSNAISPGELLAAIQAWPGYYGKNPATPDAIRAALAGPDQATAYYNLLVCMIQRPGYSRLDWSDFNKAAGALPPADASGVALALAKQNDHTGQLNDSSQLPLVVKGPSWYRRPGVPFAPIASFRPAPAPPPIVPNTGDQGNKNNNNQGNDENQRDRDRDHPHNS
jgi:hypothetical protein